MMNMRQMKKTFLILLLVINSLIIIQTSSHLLFEPNPVGETLKTEIEPISAPSFLDGSFQSSLERWISENVGFRGFFIKSDNQLNFWLFREISSKYPSRIILGKDNWLFEKSYIDTYNRLDVVAPDKLERRVTDMRRLQDLLIKRGITFLYIITPSKASIYSEYIPDSFVIKKRKALKTNYDVIIPLLDRYGIHYLDGRLFSLALKKESLDQPFPKSGTHWSYYNAYRFMETIIYKLEELSHRKMANITCTNILRSEKPINSTDADIGSLVNVFFPRAMYGTYYFPETKSDAGPGVFKPQMILVGGSFCFHLLEHINHSQISDMDFFYYFKRLYKTSTPVFSEVGPIAEKDLDWEKEVFNRDVIIIENNEQSLTNIGHGFIEQALDHLQKKEE